MYGSPYYLYMVNNNSPPWTSHTIHQNSSPNVNLAEDIHRMIFVRKHLMRATFYYSLLDEMYYRFIYKSVDGYGVL